MPPHELSMLLAAIKAEFDTRNEYTRMEFEQINKKLDALSQHGCEVGRANKIEIARIQSEAEKRGAIGGTIGGGAVSVIVTILIGVVEFFGKKGS